VNSSETPSRLLPCGSSVGAVSSAMSSRAGARPHRGHLRRRAARSASKGRTWAACGSVPQTQGEFIRASADSGPKPSTSGLRGVLAVSGRARRSLRSNGHDVPFTVYELIQRVRQFSPCGRRGHCPPGASCSAAAGGRPGRLWSSVKWPRFPVPGEAHTTSLSKPPNGPWFIAGCRGSQF